MKSQDIFVIEEYVTPHLVGLYHQNKRPYHNLNHALKVATFARELARLEMDKDNSLDVWHPVQNKYMMPDYAYVAGLWHDVVYVPGAKDNEELSATIALQSGGVNELVWNWIRHTTIADHLSDAALDKYHACLLDADVSSLAYSWDDFMANNGAICAEMKCTHQDSAEFLLKFLNKEQIYRTKYCKQHLEDAARLNIKKYRALASSYDDLINIENDSKRFGKWTRY